MSNNMQNLGNHQNVEEEALDLHLVLKNHEEQYSLWPDYKEVPHSWQAVFGPKPKEECLEYVKENWTDMRPLSLRKKMLDLQSPKQ